MADEKLLSHDQYADFWIAVPDDRSGFDPLIRTLIAHVEALQVRIDKLPNPDETPHGSRAWSQQCGCAYDHPLAVCMVHAHTRAEGEPA